MLSSAVYPIHAEPCTPLNSSETILSDSEQDDIEQRAAKRRRIERIAEQYLQGQSVYILTAGLKGPFDPLSWINPWASKKKTESHEPSKPNLKSQVGHRTIQETAKVFVEHSDGKQVRESSVCLDSSGQKQYGKGIYVRHRSSLPAAQDAVQILIEQTKPKKWRSKDKEPMQSTGVQDPIGYLATASPNSEDECYTSPSVEFVEEVYNADIVAQKIAAAQRHTCALEHEMKTGLLPGSSLRTAKEAVRVLVEQSGGKKERKLDIEPTSSNWINPRKLQKDVGVRRAAVKENVDNRSLKAILAEHQKQRAATLGSGSLPGNTPFCNKIHLDTTVESVNPILDDSPSDTQVVADSFYTLPQGEPKPAKSSSPEVNAYIDDMHAKLSQEEEYEIKRVRQLANQPKSWLLDRKGKGTRSVDYSKDERRSNHNVTSIPEQIRLSNGKVKKSSEPCKPDGFVAETDSDADIRSIMNIRPNVKGTYPPKLVDKSATPLSPLKAGFRLSGHPLIKSTSGKKLEQYKIDFRKRRLKLQDLTSLDSQYVYNNLQRSAQINRPKRHNDQTITSPDENNDIPLSLPEGSTNKQFLRSDVEKVERGVGKSIATNETTLPNLSLDNLTQQSLGSQRNKSPEPALAATVQVAKLTIKLQDRQSGAAVHEEAQSNKLSAGLLPSSPGLSSVMPAELPRHQELGGASPVLAQPGSIQDDNDISLSPGPTGASDLLTTVEIASKSRAWSPVAVANATQMDLLRAQSLFQENMTPLKPILEAKPSSSLPTPTNSASSTQSSQRRKAAVVNVVDPLPASDLGRVFREYSSSPPASMETPSPEARRTGQIALSTQALFDAVTPYRFSTIKKTTKTAKFVSPEANWAQDLQASAEEAGPDEFGRLGWNMETSPESTPPKAANMLPSKPTLDVGGGKAKSALKKSATFGSPIESPATINGIMVAEEADDTLGMIADVSGFFDDWDVDTEAKKLAAVACNTPSGMQKKPAKAKGLLGRKVFE
jgi:hypothetical protein